MGLTEQWALSFVVHIVSTWFSTEVVFANNYIMTEREIARAKKEEEKKNNLWKTLSLYIFYDFSTWINALCARSVVLSNSLFPP